METLDLHGVSHRRAEILVENFVLLEKPPLRIITGNSPKMQIIVREVLERYEFECNYETDFNLGSLIIFPRC